MKRATPSNRHFFGTIRHIALFSILAMCVAVPARSEPISLDPDAPPATLIEFKPEAKLGDFVGRAEGTVDSGGKRFYLKGLDIMAPLSIHVLTEDPSKPLDVSLHRFFWREADSKGTTDRLGGWNFVGRIHDEVGIELVASEPVDYYVLAWRGPVQKTDFGRNLFVPMATSGGASESADGTAGSIPWLAIAIVIAVAAVAIVYLLTRRRGIPPAAAALAGVACVMAGLPKDALADPMNANFGPRLAAVESGLEFVHASFEERARIIAEELQRLRERDSEFQRSFNENQSVVADRLHEHDVAIQDANAFMGDMFQQILMKLNDIEWVNEQQSIRHDDLLIDYTAMAENVANQLSQLNGDVANLYMLMEHDRDAIPDPAFAGFDPMPSSCFVSSSPSPRLGIDTAATTTSFHSACAECFSAANEKLVERMELYEKLRTIYATNKSLSEYAVFFGDAISGWHQLEQAQWYNVKLRIKDSQMKVTRAYNAKFEEFNQKLDDILHEFGRCEAMAGSDEWYERYGTLFYYSVVNAYRNFDDTRPPF